uniref:Uncharacterized protein n=1 Tax=Rhizophora mucronata TaxID=61149 RepID=A0A2P2M6Z3_RHIMU
MNQVKRYNTNSTTAIYYPQSSYEEMQVSWTNIL